MHALILAAGKGSRMMPLTAKTPKCLLEICDRAIIERQLAALNQSGIMRTTVIGGYLFDQIKERLGDRVEYVFNPFYETTNSIVSLWLALLTVCDDILITNSDVIFQPELVSKMTASPKDITIAVSRTWDPSRGYKAEIQDGMVRNMGMHISDVGGEYAGMIYVSRNIVSCMRKKIESMFASGLFNVWFEDMIVELIKNGVCAQAIDVDVDNWYEIDTVEELEYARLKFS